MSKINYNKDEPVQPGSITAEVIAPEPTTLAMSLRDAAALAALPALIARHRADVPWDAVCPLAFEIADAFIAARKTEET